MAALPIITAVATVAGSAIAAAGAIQSSRAAAATTRAQIEANEVRTRAAENEVQAVAQVKAANERRKTAYLVARQEAEFAGSGGGVVGSVYDVIGETALRGKLNEETELWQGGQEAVRLRNRQDADASIGDFGARQTVTAGNMKAGTAIMSGMAGFAKGFKRSDFSGGGDYTPDDGGDAYFYASDGGVGTFG